MKVTFATAVLLLVAVYVQSVPLDDIPEAFEEDLALVAARDLVDDEELERGLFGHGYYPSYIHRPKPPRPSRKQTGAIHNSNYNRNSNKITDVSSLFSSIINQLISSQYSSQKPSRPSYRPPHYPPFYPLGIPRFDEDLASSDSEVTDTASEQESSVSK